ncbi:hypothetical protein QQ008_28220 [Fulvivirgaceae bacterium BMA10]|uniref:ABM domain-containing protein n=1 Tax=Splendidivirga corallicola TaxID=3051826 RepID=A0ABT8KY78_9BACT|nr:hypothetical protein [Fulvivirgaceae bacterium BMA10]
MFVAIWKYEVDLNRLEQFEELYGQKGKWVALFKKATGYINTELVKDTSSKNVYISLDKWESQALYEQFYEENKSTIDSIDKEGDELTLSETNIGWFNAL